MRIRILKYGNLAGSPDCKELLLRAGPGSSAAQDVWVEVFGIKQAFGLNGQSTSVILEEPAHPRAFPALVDVSYITPAGDIEDPVERALSDLAAQGLSPDEIKSLLVTHPHPDHFDVRLARRFPEATVFAPSVQGEATRPSLPGAELFSADHFAGLIEAVDTPGHGCPHTSFLVDLPQHDLTVCLAGDLIMSHAHFLSLDHPLSFMDHDAGQASLQRVRRAMQRRNRARHLVVPGHDIPFFLV